ncbi:DMT family transporter [Methylopila sp. M107]|uniref:DMT family transporter n=1 Tax=Methylopila sp. M107 TaxID=1101190 RepID=UPI00036B095D|nr:DMT family transporter [Methylopila sp. M107]
MPAFSTAIATRTAAVDATTRGVAAMLVGMGFQVLNDGVIKLVSARLPATEIMGLRGVLAIGFALCLILAMGLRGQLRTLTNPLVALRSGLEACACLSYMTALAHLGLAEFTSIVQVAPLIITALAFMIGWQKVSWRRWVAVGAGFVGVLLIVRPSAHGVNAYAALALLSAVFMAVRDLVTSKIPSGAPSMVVTLGSTIAVTLVGFGAGAANPVGWTVPGGLDFALIALGAALVVACNMMIVLAFRLGDMTVVGPFRYSVILGSLALGWAIWGERPDALALVGSAVIVASGLYTLRRQPVATPAAPQG